MSLINKMLQDLDRRNAGAGASDLSRSVTTPSRPVRSILRPAGALVLVALVAGGIWYGWQFRPSKHVSDTAFQAPPDRPKAALPAPAPAPKPQAQPAPPPAPQPEPASKPPLGEATTVAEAKAPTQAPAAKRAPRTAPRKKAPTDSAEAGYRRAVDLLNAGRVSEAEELLARVLQATPSHAASRQAYAALLLEQGRVGAARSILADGLALDPSQAIFAQALTRIYLDQQDYPRALEVIDRAGDAARQPGLQALRGAVLRRMGRYADAATAYGNAIRGGPQPGTTWLGLAVCLENLQRREEAAEAYRRAIAAGELTQALRDYADAKLRALQ